jgi:hypothetical protein
VGVSGCLTGGCRKKQQYGGRLQLSFD